MRPNRAMLVLFTLAVVFAVNAQTTRYTVPKKLPIEGLVRRTFPDYFRPGERFPSLIPETFFPIGWSKDGKFAYYYEPVDEACGCYYARLIIQDLRTDRVLWEFRYDQSDETDPKTGDMLGEGDVRKLWRKNQRLFSNKLGEYQIVQSRSTMLSRRFASGGRQFTASAKVIEGKDEDQNRRVKTLTISLSTPKLGAKMLYRADNGSGEDLFVAPLDADVIGVIKSPFENRVAVVAIEAQRGWEGPPHTGNILIVGADLTSGFTNRPDARAEYPAVWFAAINDPNKPAWEILPQEARAGEVILSKRNELGILSNFAATQFEMDGKRYASVEGFWQMMLYPEGPSDARAADKRVTWKFTREQVAQMTAFEAKSAGSLAEENMKKLGIDWVTYQGKRFPYRSATPGDHYKLIVDAMRAKLEQNPEVKRILLATGDLILKPDHHGEENAPPEWKYYDIWMQLRLGLRSNRR